MQARLGSFLFVLSLGLVARLYLLNNTSLVQWLSNRVELITPLNSWQRVEEGVFLTRRNLTTTAYAGDLVHELPVMLAVYSFLIDLVQPVNIPFVFVLIDGLNAILLFSIVGKFIAYLINTETSELKEGKYTRYLQSINGGDSLILTVANFNSFYWSLMCLAVYLFNPFQIAACITSSTVTIHNALLLLWLYFLIQGKAILALTCLAIHSNINVYSTTLIAASIGYLIKTDKNKLSSIVKYSLLFFTLTIAFAALNISLVGSENRERLVESTYLFVLKVPDLLPNMGLFWYFFTEMFDHFLLFFTFVFQMNAFIYAIPLTIRLEDVPVLNLIVQIALIAIFKSYPSVADVGFYLSMLPFLLNYLFGFMRNFLFYACMLLVSFVLAPVMFYLWLGSGGGNANFYFAITLVYSLGQIFLILDLLYANMKRDYIKANGIQCPKNKDGTDARLTLE